MEIDPQTAHVLVVEDNPDNLFIVMDLLQAEVGVRYCNARASGRQLFKLLESQPDLMVDLILLDIQMPHEDGYAIVGQLRQTPALRATKIIAVTANVMPQDVERARNSGFDGFIGKPINADRFPQQIRQILAGRAVWEPR
jgi:two-component system cell cycle response regulator DivK